MITYTWTINSLNVAPVQGQLTNVVVGINWTYTGTDENNNTFSTWGYTPVNQVNNTDYTEYADLTLDTIISWITDPISPLIDINFLQNEISTGIAQIINPPIITMSPPF